MKKETAFVIKSFLGWRVGLFFVAFLAIFLIPAFGARFPYYDRVLEITKLPNWIWGFGNFDGVHYLRIAQDGYIAQFSQAFFPLFPVLIRAFASVFPKIPNLDTNIFTDPSYFYSGLILSNLFFLAAIVVFYKLVRLDFNEKIARWSVIALLVFPTSFYFGSIYTESLFLLLAAGSIYLIRKKRYFFASLLIGLATATRLIGVFLVLIYLVEAIKSKDWGSFYYLPFMFLGAGLYIYYLQVTFNNPLYFLTSQPVFGAGRFVDGIILFPQVVFRYIKIFLSTNMLSLAFFNASLEFFFTLVPLTLILVYIRKIRLSYWVFSFCTLILPTLTGTFSSMPRYALISLFLFLPFFVSRLGRFSRLALVLSCLLGFILLSLFIRGYWVA